MNQYKPEDLVCLTSPKTSLLKTSSRKFKVIYIEPLVVCMIREKSQYILMDIKGKILNDIFHFNCLKQAYLRTTRGPVNTLVDLKQTLNIGIRIN